MYIKYVCVYTPPFLHVWPTGFFTLGSQKGRDVRVGKRHERSHIPLAKQGSNAAPCQSKELHMAGGTEKVGAVTEGGHLPLPAP